jgi:7-cyano-7-deazaguanine synthase
MKQEGFDVYPLFVNYGQKAGHQELAACTSVLHSMALRHPEVVDLSGYGKLLPSGLTSEEKDVFLDAFLPGRNLLFLLVAAAYAYQVQAAAVGIGLLDEASLLFPDQSSQFLEQAEAMLKLTLGYDIRVLAPLRKFSKRDVIRLARQYELHGTYSCHVGTEIPCGHCISCREFQVEEV